MTLSVSGDIVFSFKSLFYLIFPSSILKPHLAAAGMISALVQYQPQ